MSAVHPAALPSPVPSRGSRQASAGFSLIEIVIAVGIFAFVIIPVIGLVSGGMKNLRQSMDDTVRADIAKAIVGEALRSPYSNVVSATNYYNDEGIQQGSQNAQTIFNATTTVTSLTSDSSLGLTTDTNIAKQLTVTVKHVSDPNNKTVYTQLLINTAQ